MTDQQTPPDDAAPPPSKPQKGFSLWKLIAKLFEGMHWLTERVISLLRLFVTVAMFSVVAFIIYNAWASRNTVAVKPFQVPVSVGEGNHKQAGRIIANLLNRHLLETQDTLQEQLNLSNLDRPVAAEEQVLIEGESIKLPETGISIDNVIEFISGIFGRKNLHGSVYFEPDLKNPDKHKLHLQITLRGRILSLSENDLGKERRAILPETKKDGLNIRLISEMLKAHSKDILSIASEDYNLYYYCTRNTNTVEHKEGDYQPFFNYCRDLQNPNATPKTLQALRDDLEQQGNHSSNSIAGAVMIFLKDESSKKQATLCQSEANRADSACKHIKLANARPLPSSQQVERMSRVTTTLLSDTATISYTRGNNRIIEALTPVISPIMLDSLEALESKCELARTRPATSKLDIVPPLEQQCFTSPILQQAQQRTAPASPEAARQASQLEGDATQLLHNGLYEQALIKYQEAIQLNCNNAVAWANMGILLSTSPADSGVREIKQGQCALLRATQLNENAGWMRHSLCTAQAFESTVQLERYLDYESCRLARLLEPINEALYDKLFYIDIADKYRELEHYDEAVSAYRQSMISETNRTCNMKKVVESLLELDEQDVEEAKEQACAIYRSSSPSAEKVIPECEVELNTLASEAGCV